MNETCPSPRQRVNEPCFCYSVSVLSEGVTGVPSRSPFLSNEQAGNSPRKTPAGAWKVPWGGVHLSHLAAGPTGHLLVGESRGVLQRFPERPGSGPAVAVAVALADLRAQASIPAGKVRASWPKPRAAGRVPDERADLWRAERSKLVGGHGFRTADSTRTGGTAIGQGSAPACRPQHLPGSHGEPAIASCGLSVAWLQVFSSVTVLSPGCRGSGWGSGCTAQKPRRQCDQASRPASLL